jgi:uncharacterized protein affecting Mg2+/Co2+ transport
VVGQFPVLSEDSPMHSYTSQTQLDTDRGLLGGYFTFATAVRELIDIPIPTMSLQLNQRRRGPGRLARTLTGNTQLRR